MISLEHISKKFQRHWIFKDVNYTFNFPGTYALLGPNGSGKSTLLRIISGMQAASVGKVHYTVAEQKVAVNRIFPHIAYTAPGQEIIEELTLKEFFSFHFKFKQAINNMPVDAIIDAIGMDNAANKPIGDFSSGMKQRVKLAQAIFADTPILLLDEPCSNLDQSGVNQYKTWIDQHKNNRLVIVASNDEREYYFCNHHIKVEDYK